MKFLNTQKDKFLLYGQKTWSLTQREEHMQRVFESSAEGDIWCITGRK